MSQILVCDYCKTQADKAGLIRVIFKQGKKELHKYDICPACHETLLAVFTAKFIGHKRGASRAAVEGSPKDIVQAIEDGDINPEKMLEPVSASARTGQERRMKDGPETVTSVDDDGKCLHINKSPVVFGKGVKVPYQQCRDCRKRIPIKKMADRGLNDAPPQGVRIKDET